MWALLKIEITLKSTKDSSKVIPHGDLAANAYVKVNTYEVCVFKLILFLYFQTFTST